jgi:Zn-finger domain-containing protein
METQPFNQKQRDVFARMLVQAKERAQDELESDNDIDRRVECEVMPKLVEERGGTELFGRLKKLTKEVEDVEKSLENLGFDYSYGRITFSWDAPRTLRQALESAKHSARKENQLSLKTFDLAILGVWAAETADDARKIVEGLL